MGWYLPVPPPNLEGENPRTNAATWEQAAPNRPDTPNIDAHEGRVTMQSGLGGDPRVHDAWMDPDIYVVDRNGVMNGRGLFAEIPGPPPEGHGGYDPFNDGPTVDHSHRVQALFASDWNGIVQQQQMRGEHVVIMRVPPGSTQGYMPTDPGMAQANNARNMPSPWDAALTIGTALG